MEVKDYIIEKLALAKAQLEVTLLELQFENAQLKEELKQKEGDDNG